VPKNDDARSSYWALSVGLPLTARQALKFSYLKIDTHILTGYSADSLLAAWSINWGL
jgi:hypothetical protein